MAVRVCPAKKISSLSDQNASLFDPPYPLGLELWGPARYELVASHLGYLPQPSLTEAPPTWLLKHGKGLLPGYRRQVGEKVLLQIWPGFHKLRHVYFSINAIVALCYEPP